MTQTWKVPPLTSPASLELYYILKLERHKSKHFSKHFSPQNLMFLKCTYQFTGSLEYSYNPTKAYSSSWTQLISMVIEDSQGSNLQAWVKCQMPNEEKAGTQLRKCQKLRVNVSQNMQLLMFLKNECRNGNCFTVIQNVP